MQNQITQAESHLKVLRVFHYVYAGLTLLGIAFLVFHYFIMKTMLATMPTEVSTPADGSQPPPVPEFDEFMDIMIWVYIFGAVIFLLIGIVNLLSANFIGSRKFRIFSIIVAGLNCLYIPFGTVLGVFTIVILMKPITLYLYGEQNTPPNLPPST